MITGWTSGLLEILDDKRQGESRLVFLSLEGVLTLPAVMRGGTGANCIEGLLSFNDLVQFSAQRPFLEYIHLPAHIDMNIRDA